MTPDERKFIKMLVDRDAKVKESQEYIKENYNIDSIFDSDTDTITLTCESDYGSYKSIKAKKYLEDAVQDSDFIDIVF